MSAPTLCHECCSPYIRQARPEVVTLDENDVCPNCDRWYEKKGKGSPVPADK